MNKETVMSDIQLVEKGLKASEDLRQEALTKKSMYQVQLKETDTELEGLGTTAETARKEMEEIDKLIEERLTEVKAMIPFELLKKWGRL